MLVIYNFHALLKPQIGRVSVHNPVIFPNQPVGHRHIVDIGGCSLYRVDIACPSVHTRMALHPGPPLVPLENQKRILEDSARKNGFTNIRHFTDDGIRGTTFKRPGLDAMLDEIRAGNVATVIIKDQSRIGRDVVEVGLLKRTFDEYHVRFIAANDNLDTANGFDIMSIFRDVINEWHAEQYGYSNKYFFG